MRDIGKVVGEAKPTIVMVVMQTAFVGLNIMFKLAINDGMSMKIIVAYRLLFASAFMLPLAFFLERTKRPKLTWIILLQGFVCGLFGGVLSQNFYMEGLALTSATFASALSNLNPVATFIMALCFRMEKLNVGTTAGRAKIIGTITGIGGAMILTLYKGPQIPMGSFHHLHLLHHQKGHVASSQESSSTMTTVLGALCILGSNFAYAIWLIFQTKMGRRYPHYSSTALVSVMGFLISFVFALSAERDWAQWKLGFNVRLLAVAYLGIVCSGLTVLLTAWCVNIRGPLFVSVFSPLVPLMVALAGPFMLDENLYLGTIIGGVFIVCGLYLVLWGKGKEMKEKKKTEKLAPGTVEVVVKSPAAVDDDSKLNCDVANFVKGNECERPLKNGCNQKRNKDDDDVEATQNGSLSRK